MEEISDETGVKYAFRKMMDEVIIFSPSYYKLKQIYLLCQINLDNIIYEEVNIREHNH